MEENMETDLLGLLRTNFHEQDIVVRGERGLAIDGRHLVLSGGYLIVHDCYGHSKLEHHFLD
eukprot:80867-Amphidinium_carterae.1